MRQRYETHQHKAKEQLVIEQYIETFDNQKIIYQKLPVFYQLDYALYWDNRMREIAEVKCRTNHYGKYDTLILSVHKLQELVRWRVTGVRPVLLAQFTDGLYDYVPDIESLKLPIRPGGRTDRNDWQDQEPVYHIPIERLRMIR